MSCYLCQGSEYAAILGGKSTPIWNDAPDDHSLGVEMQCTLNQCLECGHVYQPVTNELRTTLRTIYNSEFAQGVSSMGIGSWGKSRAEALFFDHIDTNKYSSAMEIGCGDGYLLKRLKESGVKHLLGIEPSVNVSNSNDAITIYNNFLDPKQELLESYDLIFSIAVLEHVEEIGPALEFCRNQLRACGDLFFVVPDCQPELESGDPALFTHQHIHYFTPDTIKALLEYHDLSATKLATLNNNLLVWATPKLGDSATKSRAVTYFHSYGEKLQTRLSMLEKYFVGENVLVHGACNALNNIVAWTEGSFRLVDNDENKIGRKYGGRLVENPGTIDLESVKTIVVLPTSCFKEISQQYKDMGFMGNIINTETVFGKLN